MSVDPDLRITIGFILALRAALAISLPGMVIERGLHQQLQWLRIGADSAPKRIWKLLIWILLLVPLLAFLFDARGLTRLVSLLSSNAIDYSSMWLPEAIRWLLMIPAISGLLLGIWIRQYPLTAVEGGPDEARGTQIPGGPYRLIRFPDWSADMLLLGALLLATSQWLAVISLVADCWILRHWYLPQADKAWRRLLGEHYDEYAKRTGLLLPRFPQLQHRNTPEYSVPRRFGMSAIIALVTMFAIMFGILNAIKLEITEFELPLTVHLFFGTLLMLVWIAQMRFTKSARWASVLVGAVLMPLFILLSAGHPTRPGQLGLVVIVFGGLGGVIGYCMGALAAGLFLVADWLGPYLPGARR